ncbi:MAG: tRNA (N6-isopentenyl adenosine(37)-C2)-methylthiotransferase MiaB, partial [Actinomycetes bacterium]
DPPRRPRPGDLAGVRVTYAAPHHLTADAGLATLTRTRGGDAWAERQARPETPRPLVALGMPSLGAPEAAPASPCTSCA